MDYKFEKIAMKDIPSTIDFYKIENEQKILINRNDILENVETSNLYKNFMEYKFFDRVSPKTTFNFSFGKYEIKMRTL